MRIEPSPTKTENAGASPIANGGAGTGQFWQDPAAAGARDEGRRDASVPVYDSGTVAPKDAGPCNGGVLLRTASGYACDCANTRKGGPFCDGVDDDGGTAEAGERVLGISSLYFVTCALMESHTVRCWGRNEWGGVGDGTRTDRNTAVLVKGLSGVAQVDVGLLHACAVLDDGTVRCWGSNSSGQLHDGSNNDRTVPVVAQGITNVAQVSLGESQSCARHRDNTLECWLDIARDTVTGPNGTHNVVDVEAGYFLTTAWLADGSVNNWGTQLPIVPQGARIKRVASGYAHVCALVDDGTVYCTGDNTDGQLGTDKYGDPVSGLSSVIDIAAGFEHSCALLQDGTVRCWGQNERGQIGDGSNDDRRTPVAVQAERDVVGVQCGREHTCALHKDGTVDCWGSNQYGQLGDGSKDDSNAPVPVRGF
jgi:alpha-tubulin suppressor-like RCC1 family protein